MAQSVDFPARVFIIVNSADPHLGVEPDSLSAQVAAIAQNNFSELWIFKSCDNGATFTYLDDRFTATLGRRGAKGTFSLSDRTVDKLSGNVIQSCSSGTIKWTAAP